MLVVLEEDKSLYSTLWADLEGIRTLSTVLLCLLSLRNMNCILICVLTGRGYDITFESPKSDQLSLFAHGEKAYDHLILLPSKSKGQWHARLCLK